MSVIQFPPSSVPTISGILESVEERVPELRSIYVFGIDHNGESVVWCKGSRYLNGDMEE